MEPQSKIFSVKKTLRLGNRLLSLECPAVMGIINATPDSFYAPSRAQKESQWLRQAEHMLNAGAVILDVGGYSSRPNAEDVSEEEEKRRLLPVVQSLSKNFPEAFISVDTFRSDVAEKALDAGAHMINDISGGHMDENMLPMVARRRAAYVCTHMRGTPQNMTELTDYDDVTLAVKEYMEERLQKMQALGIVDVCLDVGFGFSKTLDQNYTVLRNLRSFLAFGQPLLVGISRKSMIWKVLNTTPEQSLQGATVVHTIALLQGASILRVHDVMEASDCIALVEKFSKA